MELVVGGVLYEPPKARFSAYLGGPHYAHPKVVLVGEVEPPGSMASVRTTAMVHGVLPLVAPAATRSLYALTSPTGMCCVGLAACSSERVAHAERSKAAMSRRSRATHCQRGQGWARHGQLLVQD